MAVFRGTDQIRRAAAAVKDSLRHVWSGSLKGITVVENKRLQNVSRFILNNRRPVAATAVAALGIAGIVLSGFQYVKAHTAEYYHVYVKGAPVGDISEPRKVEQWLAAKAAALDRADTSVREALDKGQVAYRIERAYKPLVNDEATLNQLEKRISTHPVAVQLIVDGRVVGLVRDRETADRLLKRIQDRYTPAAAVHAHAAAKTPSPRARTLAFSAASAKPVSVVPANSLSSVEFVEPVDIAEVDLGAHTLSDPEKLYQQLVADQPSGPLLTVRTVEQVTEIESVDAPIEYRKSEEMRTGKSVVIRQGKDGQKQVTYRLIRHNGSLTEEEIVFEHVFEPPVSTIILKGSKIIAGEGTGKFDWPVLGHRITSYMGIRWGRMHKGIDIIGKSSILAADNGMIEFAGYKSGGMGNMVIIDHKNGFKTVYGHMKSIKVTEGQIVEKGDQLGVMGSTGHSTGTHLHFEIYQDGKLKNPTSFL